MAKSITKAIKDRALKNFIDTDVNTKPIWHNILDVVEKDGTIHQEICNGYSLIRFNDDVLFDNDNFGHYSVDLNNETEETKGFSQTVGAEGVIKVAKRDCVCDVTDKLPALADMVEICKTTNRRSKFIKDNYGCRTLVYAFTDRADNYSGDETHIHMFNLNLVYRALLLTCTTFQTEYKIYVKEGDKIGFMLIVGDIGAAVVLPMRFDNNPIWRIATLNEAFDKINSVKTEIADTLYNKFTNEENPYSFTYTDINKGIKETINVGYDKLVFKNTVEFYLKEYMNEECMLGGNTVGGTLKVNEFETLIDDKYKIIDALTELYSMAYYVFTKNHDKIVKGFEKLGKEPEWDRLLKEYFVTHMYLDFTKDSEYLTRYAQVGDAFKIYQKYYKGINAA